MDYIPFAPPVVQSVDVLRGTVEESRRPWIRRQKSASQSSAAICHNDRRGPDFVKDDLIQIDTSDCRDVATVAMSPAQIDDFHEKSAIAEYEGRLPRLHAEVLAALQCLDLGPDGAKILDAVAKRLEFLTAVDG